MQDHHVLDLVDLLDISSQPIVNGYSRPKWLPEVMLNYLKLCLLLKGSQRKGIDFNDYFSLIFSKEEELSWH